MMTPTTKLGLGIVLIFAVVYVSKNVQSRYFSNKPFSDIIMMLISVIGTMASVYGLLLPGVIQMTVINDSTNQSVSAIGNNNTISNIENQNIIFAGGYTDVDSSIVYPQEERIEKEDKEGAEELQYDTLKTWTVGWYDGSRDGRSKHTLDEVNEGVLGDRVVFNSISNSVIGDEFNFVGARENTGINRGIDNTWSGNEIIAEEGKSYLVRLYAHNNNPCGYDAAATDVWLQFILSDTKHVLTNDLRSVAGDEYQEGYYGVSVHGLIFSENAEPSMYADGVKFVSHRPFRLEYIPGTARYANNGIAANVGIGLGDEIVSSGVRIGYDSLDGIIPGCYQYASYTSITVVPVFEDE